MFFVIDSVFDKIVDREFILLKFTDGNAGTVNGNRTNNRINTRAIRQARIDSGAVCIHTAPQRENDAVNDPQNMVIVIKSDAAFC